jgi:hypothetical protein
MKPTRSVVNRILIGFGVLLALGVAWLAMFWIASVDDNHQRLVRSRASELYAVAGLCKTAVAQYYAARKRMPADEKDAGCESGTDNVTAPRVANGVVTAAAQGKLAQALTEEKSGLSFTYTPVCGGTCDGGPITAWDCKSATTIEPRFRPASCR